MSTALSVFREYQNAYQLVGSLEHQGTTARFRYAQSYLADASASAISVALPLRGEAFSYEETHNFFEGLLPEGELRTLIARTLHLDVRAYAALLARLNNESIGALVFSLDGRTPLQNRSYELFDEERLRDFARQPLRIAVDASLTTRLSLAGAQTKIGLYCHQAEGQDDRWYLPKGLASSTHIIKAPSEVFPLQTVNEAFCLGLAKSLGIRTANHFLIALEAAEPLLAIERFDRFYADNALQIGGLAVPSRMHQEDFCQATQLPSYMKYEPTDGNFLNRVARTLDQEVAKPLEDRLEFSDRVMLDYLVGNCDNHLKNYSLLRSEDWLTCGLSPHYDVTCTTYYPSLAREMGISLCESRRIDDVAAANILEAAKRVGIPAAIGKQRYIDLLQKMPAAIDATSKSLSSQSFSQVRDIAQFVKKELASKVSEDEIVHAS